MNLDMGNEHAPEEAPAPGKKVPWKLIAIVTATLVVLAAGGVGARFYLKKRAAAKAAALALAEAAAREAAAAGGQPEASELEDCEDLGAKKEGAGEAPPVMVLTRTLNLQGPRRNAFLRCELHVLFCDAELGKLVSGDKPSAQKSIIQATVLAVLAGKSVEEASDAESRESLRKEIKDKLNEQFRPHLKPGEVEDPKHRRYTRPIKSVLIVDWAIQQ